MLRVGTSIRVPPVRGPGASEVCYQHPWGAKTHAPSVLFLPALLGNLFGEDRVAHTHDLVDQPAMQALAMGR